MTRPVARRRSLAVALVVTAAVTLALALGAGVGGAVYARREPTFCVRCHEPEGEHTKGHARVACQRCHTAADTGAFGLVLAAVGARASAPHGGVRRESCVGCHRGDEDAWRALMADPEHRRHLNGNPRAECVRCHAGSLHGRPSAREGCRQCHRETPMLSEPRSESACTGCHAFGRGATDLSRVVARTDRTVSSQQVHGAADCRGCHDPHRADDASARARRVECVRCHAGRHAAEVAAGPPGHRDCVGCHTPHASRAEQAFDCSRCHAPPPPETPGTQSPTDARRWPLHATANAAPPPSEPPRGAHGGRCVSCHRPHTWEAQRSDCRGCHTTQATSLATLSSPAHQDCVSCHAPHGRAPDASTCRGCHAEPAHRGALATTPAAHRDCLACHAPHGGRTEASHACNRCHESATHPLAAGPTAHQECTACHASHGPPSAPTSNACSNCHGARGAAPVEAPRSPGHARCEGCHRPHEFAATAATRGCEGCHRETLSHGSAHDGECGSCHAPHSAARDRARDCASCHATTRVEGTPRALIGHARCQSCHTPHRDVRAARSACATCHPPEAAARASWSGRGPHGGDCATCHAPHRAGAPATCASCHVAQATTAHTGTHRECTSCHAPHSPRPGAGDGGWWGRCASCHTTQATLAATATGTHRNCADCHDRSGRTAPTCESCHTTARATLLHATPQHQNCANCHANHGTAPATRAQCLTCHASRATHFPDAPRCQSCHPFAR